ncbi:MAG: hypothetical protein MI755_20295 [Sphingomonadales bacterium]|nr:hypothetical protein [Sphingomonadales bacterium]
MTPKQHARVFGALAAILLAWLPAPGLAQSEVSLETLKACRAEATDAAKLACFMAATAGLDEVGAAEVKEQTIVTPAILEEKIEEARAEEKAAEEAAEEERKEAEFGLAEAKRDKRKTVELSIVFTRRSPSKRWVFVTEDGQVWRQVDTDRILLPKEMPLTATVRRALFGSFLMKVEGVSEAIRVTRLE